MSTDDTYNGWANRETWAVSLYVDNDQGWYNSVRDALIDETVRRGEEAADEGRYHSGALHVGDASSIVRQEVERVLEGEDLGVVYGNTTPNEALIYVERVLPILLDIGSLYRIDWDALGAYYLEDIQEA